MSTHPTTSSGAPWQVLPSQMAIAVLPHLIPSLTIPNGDLERALNEPLAHGRDEVIYLVCSHPRLKLGEREPDGSYPILLASGLPEGGIEWNTRCWWGRALLPAHARPSRIPWAVLDTALESEEGLPRVDADFSKDPDGEDGHHRAELLPWVYDRHLELTEPPQVPRGQVDGGRIDLRVEYVGSSGQEALRRPAGAHHRLPTILGRMLLYEPHRLVYLMVCELRVALYDEAGPNPVSAGRIADVVNRYAIERTLLITAAEDALIAAIAAPYNTRNTGRRRFPASAAGERLRELGVRRVMLGFYGLPDRVRLEGSQLTWTNQSGATVFDIDANAVPERAGPAEIDAADAS
jgi:hypothetical protein